MCLFCRINVREVLDVAPTFVVPSVKSHRRSGLKGGDHPRFLVLSSCTLPREMLGSHEYARQCRGQVPPSLDDSVSLDWFTRLCHINGVEFSVQGDLIECMVAGRIRMPTPALRSLVSTCVKQQLHVTCFARCCTTREQWALSATSPSLILQGLPVFQRLQCFTGA